MNNIYVNIDQQLPPMIYYEEEPEPSEASEPSRYLNFCFHFDLSDQLVIENINSITVIISDVKNLFNKFPVPVLTENIYSEDISINKIIKQEDLLLQPKIEGENYDWIKPNNYYKIQLKITFKNDNNIYYSNYGISQVINKTTYGCNFFLVDGDYTVINQRFRRYDKQWVLFNYSTGKQENIIKFYSYQILDMDSNIIYNQDWIANTDIFYNTSNLPVSPKKVLTEIIDWSIGSITQAFSLNKNNQQVNSLNFSKGTEYKGWGSIIPMPVLNLNPYKQYTLKFKGITGLNLNTEQTYTFQLMDLCPLRFPAKINMENNYNEGYVKINFIPYFTNTDSDDLLDKGDVGARYELYRTDEFSNFEFWEYLTDFVINQYTINDYEFKDYWIQQGVKYKYGIKLVNQFNIRTHLIESLDYVIADFEDMFLIDADKIVKIKYNPKVSTFKTNKNESKIETLGSSYPFISRNGQLKYKEMVISGLISFQMDDFLTNQLSQQKGIKEFEHTDLVSFNIFNERQYKNDILNWLNNNKYKVLKTPTEGNFIIQLVNVNLTPIDSLGRMLHQFQATAYEVDLYSQENLIKYNIYSTQANKENNIKIETLIIPNYSIPNNSNEPDNSIEAGNNQNIKEPRVINNKLIVDFIEPVDSIQFFGFSGNPTIIISYKDSHGNNGTSDSEITIGRTSELVLNNTLPILSIVLPQSINNTLQAGITYSWIRNESREFNDITDIPIQTSDIENTKSYNSISLETINQSNLSNVDYIKIKNKNSKSVLNFIYEKGTSVNYDGIFVAGNNLYRTDNKRLQSYLLIRPDPPGNKNKYIYKIPQAIKLSHKSFDLIDNNDKYSLASSFFILSNRTYSNYGVEPNKLYRLPEFGEIYLTNLEDITGLWIGKNLMADVEYLQYTQSLNSQGE